MENSNYKSHSTIKIKLVTDTIWGILKAKRIKKHICIARAGHLHQSDILKNTIDGGKNGKKR